MKPPVCQHLRTKKMFIPALAGEVLAEPHDDCACGPCHYWCNRTLTEVGPDDQAVHLEICTVERACFEE